MQQENICRYKKSMSCRRVSVRHLPIIVSNGTVNERESSGRYPTKTFGYDRHFYMNGNNAFTPALVIPVLAGQAEAEYSAGRKGGFTLIELLVVVLIIGILAAVAVPQYTLAVDKARLSNLMSVMQSLKNAQEVYYTANGTYATDWDTLDIEKPANTDYTLYISSAPQGIYGRYNSLKNVILTTAGAHATGAGSEHKGKWLCYAKKTDERANKLCQYIAQRKTTNWVADTELGQANTYVFTR